MNSINNDQKIVPVYDELYPIRENLFLTLDKEKNIYLDASLQGTGKTTFALRACAKYVHTTIILVDNHDKGMEIYEDCKKYFSNISYLVSRTYECNCKMQKVISEILEEDFKGKYVCNKCNKDNEVLEVFNKLYMNIDSCWNDHCDERNYCYYFKLKDHTLKKRQFKENRLIILVKPYIYTKYFQGELLETHEDYALIIDEGMVECLTKSITFGRDYLSNKTYKDWIKMVDKIIELVNQPEILLTTLWKEIKEFFQIILNYKLTIEEREQKILDHLMKMYNNHGDEEEFKNWNETLKMNATYYYFYEKKLDDLVINKFTDFFDIIEYIFLISYNFYSNIIEFKEEEFKNEIQNAIFINEQNKEFSFDINYKEYIESNIENSKLSLIPASNMKRNLFVELFPHFENNLIFFKSNHTTKTKITYQKTTGNYFKSTLFNPIPRKDKKTGKKLSKFTKQYDRLLVDLHYILEREKTKKILIVAQQTISNKLKHDLKKILDNRNVDVMNTTSIEYFYNLEGKNKFLFYDVIIIFGGAGIPIKRLTKLCKRLDVSYKSLYNYFVPGQHIQCIERIRTILFPYQKIVYILCNIEVDIPKEQIIKFRKIEEIDFLEKLKDNGASNIDDCLNLYNKTAKKEITKQRLNNILDRMIKDDVLMRFKHSKGKGRPVWFYTIFRN